MNGRVKQTECKRSTDKDLKCRDSERRRRVRWSRKQQNKQERENVVLRRGGPFVFPIWREVLLFVCKVKTQPISTFVILRL